MKRSHLLASALVFGGSVLGGAAVSSADLVHRYSFNNGTANDSVGTANGTVNGAAVIAAGGLTTTGGSGDYVSLPAGVGTGITGDFTVEQFVTIPTNPNNFSSLFSLSSPGNRNFFLVNPSRPNANGTLSANFQQKTGVVNGGDDTEVDIRPATTTPFPFGVTQHDVAITYVAATNLVTVYLDGTSIASGSIAAALSGSSLNLEALTSLGNSGINGNGPFGDASLTGTTDEFRIYNSALTSQQAAASFTAGPNAVVPEPAALGLLGLVGLAAARRRRNA